MKILFVQPSLITGGVEKSLINIMDILSKKNEVHLYLLSNTGEMLPQVPKSVKIINSNFKSNTNLSERSWLKNIIFKLGKFFLTVFGLKNIVKKIYSIKQAKKSIKELKTLKFDEEYDIVVSFHGLNFSANYLATNCFKSKRKVVFFHGDVSFAKNINWVFKYYHDFNNIVLVSKSCKEMFDKLYPHLPNKTSYLYNLQDEKAIIKNSILFEPNFDKKSFNIISVSRLSEEKAYIRSLKVVNKLVKENYNFQWHILGSGPEKIKIEKFILKHKIEKHVKLYGNQTNPYPYIKDADLLFLGSIHEAAPMVFNESLILKTPVLTTNTCSANELIGKNGFVCENSSDGIYKTLKNIFENKKIYEEKKELASKFIYKKEKYIDYIVKFFEN